MEATEVSVYGFIYKLMCSGSQQNCELITMMRMRIRIRLRIKRAKSLIMFFCGATAATFVSRYMWMQSRSGGIIT